jgi:hypothetical protein
MSAKREFAVQSLLALVGIAPVVVWSSGCWPIRG